jgi:Transketolase, thiamine diphosphate binding domain
VATDTLTASEVDLDRLAVDTVRVLAMDAIQKAGSGHPGTAMALLAPAACVLWTRFLRFDPVDRSGSTGTGSCSRPATRGAAVCGVAPDRVPAGRPGPQAAPGGVPDPGPPRVRAHGHAAVVALLAHGLASGRLDLALLARVGRAHAEGLRLIVTAWNQVYRMRFEGPLLAAGGDQRTPWSWPPS